MNILREISQLAGIAAPVDLAIGFFDGIHRGHAAVIESAVRGQGVPVMLTFDPHPAVVLRPDAVPPLLCTFAQKAHYVSGLGVEHLLAVPFDRDRAAQSAEAFIAELAAAQTIASISIGEGFRFGNRRGGDLALLEKLATEHGFQVHGIAPVTEGIEAISSTRLRAALSAGEFTEVRQLLGRPYSLFGTVARGKQLGRTIGFPTANVPDLPAQLPPCGVYAVHLLVGNERLNGVANLGLRPTVDGGTDAPLLEVHLLDRDLDLYEREVEVVLLDFLRAEQKFDGLEPLKAQIANDVQAARALFEGLL